MQIEAENKKLNLINRNNKPTERATNKFNG